MPDQERHAQVSAVEIARLRSEESPPGRFRLPEEVRLAIQRIAPGPVPDEVWAAVARLVRYYAVQASDWAVALRSVTDH